MRFSDPKTGKIFPPMAFLPPAERYNLMPKIDRWVVENILNYLSNSTPESNTIYSINLSGASSNDEQFINFLKQQLSSCLVDPEILCVEITETVAISNLQKAAKLILELKKIGCHFALDLVD